MDEITQVVDELATELRDQYPPVEDSIALFPWTCAHGVTYPDWYHKEVGCELLHASDERLSVSWVA